VAKRCVGRPARTTALLLGAAAALFLGKPGEADWPVFRGNPVQTGVAEGELPNPLQVLWQHKAKKAFESTAAISGGMVYVGCEDELVYALKLSDGEVKWKYKAGAPVRVGVAASGECVYAGDEDGVLHCIHAQSGEQKWIYDTKAEITSAASFDGDRVLFGAGDSLLYCLDKNTGGKPLWTFKVPGGPVMGSPAIIGGKTFVAGCDNTLHVIDVTNGKELQSVELSGQVGATPALIGDHLYIGTMTNQVQAVNWKKREISWTYEAKKKQQPFAASVAATDEFVLGASRDRCLHGIDRKTGNATWIFTTEGKLDSSPVVAGKRVYVPSNDGKLYVLTLATGERIQAIELATRGILASPAVSDGRLVIGTIDGMLYCLGQKAPK
jgi:outer membrane protein assembly factor BamB